MPDSPISKREQRRREQEFQKNYAKSRDDQAKLGRRHTSMMRLLPRVLFVLAAIIAAQHLIFHAANGRGQAALIEDIFLGYPMAAVIAVVAAFMLPATRSK